MKLTEILYEDVKEIWDGYLKHPFVSGIGDGSLSLERFRFYMLQDYLYLYDYARVYALGIVKSREPEMMQFFSQLVNDTLNGEMDGKRLVSSAASTSTRGNLASDLGTVITRFDIAEYRKPSTP